MNEIAMRGILMKGFVLLGIASLLCLTGCGAAPPVTSQPNPVPTVTTISPNNAIPGAAAFTLTVNGTNFVAASIINFGGAATATTFVSSAQLTAAIPAAAVASAGTPAVTVTNPAPGGGASNVLSFTIAAVTTNPVPTISFLLPSCVPAGEQVVNPFANGQLQLFGQNFLANSVVRWNGSDRPTTFSTNSILTAQISPSDTAAAGTAAVTVFNPAPGGGTSNTSSLTITAGGVSPQSIAVDRMGKFAYVANDGCAAAFFGNVSMYTIDATTGALASIVPPVASNDEGARSVTVDPFGKFAYVANWGAGDTAGSVSSYAINSTTGALTSTGTLQAPCLPPPSPGSCAPVSVVVDPSGKFAFVANEGGFAPTSISMFTIDPTTGALTSIGIITAASRAVSVAVDPTGKFVYVASESEPSGSTGSVSTYSINASSGALTSTTMIAAGTDPVSVAVDPLGGFVYVANSGSNNVSMYTVNATTGAFTSLGTIPAGTLPVSAVVDPTGKFAYVVNSGSNDVSMYTIDAIMGTLTPIGTIAAQFSPTSIAIHPSGHFVYVTNSGSNSVSTYSINTTTGALTLIGTIGS
jgi:DNA-binding beta-propeller fold protein YncE